MIDMTTEVIRYRIPAHQADAFEQAYRQTEPILQNSSHCLGYRLLRGVEEPENWILFLYWDSVQGHEQGFRTEKGFREFFTLVKPFLNQIQEMKHYEDRKMYWSRNSGKPK
jgi:quinol monooxygenase YgiN